MPSALLSAALLAICFLTAVPAFAQPEAVLRFLPLHYSKPLRLEEGLASGDSIRVTLFRFYVSKLRLLQKDKQVWADSNNAHLIDAENEQSHQILLPQNFSYDAVQFLLGIDSVTNAAGVAGGDLDPMKGMYWAWQSGYINVKIEGTSRSCATRKNAFQFHLGGFRGADGCAQLLTFPATPGTDISLVVDVDAFLKSVDLKTQKALMTPGPEAVLLSRKMADAFHLLNPQP